VRKLSDRQRYQRALENQRTERNGIQPERITQALDIRGLYGPEVDEACGGAEPMVDEWEAGIRTPTRDQLHRLSFLTGFPIVFFYRRPEPSPGPMFICGRGGCVRA
jgi:hypothetical protein